MLESSTLEQISGSFGCGQIAANLAAWVKPNRQAPTTSGGGRLMGCQATLWRLPWLLQDFWPGPLYFYFYSLFTFV
jgi:hypothetical protein